MAVLPDESTLPIVVGQANIEHEQVASLGKSSDERGLLAVVNLSYRDKKQTPIRNRSLSSINSDEKRN